MIKTESNLDRWKRKFRLKIKRQKRYYRVLKIIDKLLQIIFRLDKGYRPL